MSYIQATIRNTKTRGELNTLRKNGNVPGIIYGGESANEKISLSKKEVKNLIDKENFLSNVISIKLDAKEQKVLPREITFDIISDEPTHIDFLRIVKGSKIIFICFFLIPFPVSLIFKTKKLGVLIKLSVISPNLFSGILSIAF